MDLNSPLLAGPSSEGTLLAQEPDFHRVLVTDRTPTKDAFKNIYHEMHNKHEFYEQVLAIMYRMDLSPPFGPQRPRPTTGCLAAPETTVPVVIQDETQPKPELPPLNHKDIRSATDLHRRLISYIFVDCKPIYDKEMSIYNRPIPPPPVNYRFRRSNPRQRPSGPQLIRPTFFRVLWSIADTNEHLLRNVLPYVATLEEDDIMLAIHSVAQVFSIPPSTENKVPLPLTEFTGYRKVLYSGISRTLVCLQHLKHKLARLPEKTVEGEMLQNAPKAVVRYTMSDRNYRTIQKKPIPSTKLTELSERLKERAERLKKEEEEKARTKPKRKKGGLRLAAKARALAIRQLGVREILRMKEPGQLTMSAKPPLPQYRHIAPLLYLALPPNWDGAHHPWDAM